MQTADCLGAGAEHHGRLAPVLYPRDGTAPPPIRPLSAFDPSAESDRHADRTLEDEPLFEGLRLYRYRPEYRDRTAA